MIEKYTVEKLRSLPIEEVAGRLGLQVQRHRALCPFHDDHTPSLTFDRRRNTCRCFVCMQRSTDTIGLVRRHLRLSFTEACQWLASEASIDITATAPPQPPKHPTDTFDRERYERYIQHPHLTTEATQFLYGQRRLDPRVVQWCGLTTWRDRHGTLWLQIPYRDTQGNLIGLQNRNLRYGQPGHETEQRFQFPRGSRCHLYNLPVTQLLKPGEPLYIAEGTSDCWALLSAGHKAIAVPSATTLSHESRQLLHRLAKERRPEFHMYPDNDTPGERLFLQLQDILPDIQRHQLPPSCKDYSELYTKTIQHSIQHSTFNTQHSKQ